MRIMDSNAVTLFDQSLTNAKDITYTLPATETYTVWVSANGLGSAGTYEFTLQRFNAPANVTPMKWGDTKAGYIVRTNFNIYSFSGQAGDLVDLPVAIITTGQGGFDMRMRIMDSNAVTLLDQSLTNAKDITYTLPATGTYTVWVSANGLGSAGTYKMTLQWFNNPANATMVHWGETKSASISEPTRIDIYSFSGQQGDRVDLPVAIGATGQSGLDLRVRIFDSNAATKLDLSFSGSKDILYTLPQTGTYLIWVNAQNNVSMGDYEFTLQRFNSPANVTPLDWGETRSSLLTNRTKIDIYSFSGQAGDKLDIPDAVLTNSPAGFPMRVRIFDRSATNLVDVYTTSNSDINYTLPAAGTYTMWISSNDLGGIGTYAFTLQRYNNPANIIPVVFGDTKTGNIVPTMIMIYSFNAHTGDDLVIPFKTTGSGNYGAYETRLRIFDANHVLILDQATQATGATQEIKYKVPAKGIFYLWVSAVSIGDYGRYQFSLSDNLLSNVTATPVFLDPLNNGQVSIGYDLQRDANVKIDLYKVSMDFDTMVESTFPGVYNRSFYKNIFSGTCPKGHCIFVWNGKDAQGSNFAEGAYVFTMTVTDLSLARHGAYDPEYVRGRVTIRNNHLILPKADPYKGELTTVAYDLVAPSWVTLRIVRLRLPLDEPVRDLLLSTPRDTTGNSEIWDGLNNNGKVVPPDTYTMYGAATLLPTNAIVVQKKNIVAVPYFHTDPYAFFPNYGELTNIKYTISKDATVSMDVRNGAGTPIRVLLNSVAQPAGTYTLVWNGQDSAGHPIGIAGDYHISLTAVDKNGGEITRNINAHLFK